MREKRPDIPDRFDRIDLKSDISEMESYEILAGYLQTARANGWENQIRNEASKEHLAHFLSNPSDAERKSFWPFTVGSAREIREFWLNKDKERKIRTFLDYARDVLEYCREKEIVEIQPSEVRQRLERHYNLWRTCLDEWKGSGIRKHKLLVRGIYKALDLARSADSELKIDNVYPELSIDLRVIQGKTRHNSTRIRQDSSS